MTCRETSGTICLYYPIGFNDNAALTGAEVERGNLTWHLFWQFLIFTSTLAHACISFVDTDEAGGNLANVLFMTCLLFCGVLAGPSTLPGFWIFMYRASPFTYWVSAVIGNEEVTCADNEVVTVVPPGGQTCGEYLTAYATANDGQVQNSNATSDCSFCLLSSTNTFLDGNKANCDTRWRDYGIGMAYIRL